MNKVLRSIIPNFFNDYLLVSIKNIIILKSFIYFHQKTARYLDKPLVRPLSMPISISTYYYFLANRNQDKKSTRRLQIYSLIRKKDIYEYQFPSTYNLSMKHILSGILGTCWVVLKILETFQNFNYIWLYIQYYDDNKPNCFLIQKNLYECECCIWPITRSLNIRSQNAFYWHNNGEIPEHLVYFRIARNHKTNWSLTSQVPSTKLAFWTGEIVTTWEQHIILALRLVLIICLN